MNYLLPAKAAGQFLSLFVFGIQVDEDRSLQSRFPALAMAHNRVIFQFNMQIEILI
jgi:hypothetical protein